MLKIVHKATYFILGIAVIILYGCAKAQPLELSDPERSEYFFKNPTNVTGIGDPWVIEKDGTYYMYATSEAAGYRYWESDDLVKWFRKGMAYTFTQNSWAKTRFWAPEVVEYNGKYYMYYSAAASDDDRSMIGVAVADSPEGPFVDVLDAPLFDDGYMNIDANVLIDDDGTKYLYYSRDCSINIVDGKKTSQIFVVRLGDDMISIIGETVFLTTPDQIWEFVSDNPLWNEGPEVFKSGNRYYLMYSSNFYGGRHYSLGYAVSDRPDGGFQKHEGNPILYAGEYKGISGTGHHGFITSPDKREMISVYHSHMYPDVGGGQRQANICSMGVTPDGTLYMNGPHIGLQPLPSGDAHRDLALDASILVNGKANHNAMLLVDHRFAVHPEQQELIWTSDTNKTTIDIKLTAAADIKSVVIYRDPGETDSYPNISLMLDKTYTAAFPDFTPSEDGLCSILHFDKVTAQNIRITLESQIGLSEVRVLGSDIN